MSKTPIREAISLLEREGFVQVLPRRGTLVRSIELRDIQNTFLVRMLVEPEAAALAAARATKEQLRTMADLADRSRLRDRARGEDHLSSHRAFHLAVAEASGIAELLTIIRSLHDKVEWFYSYEGITLQVATSEHEKDLAAAIRAGDPDRARQLATENIARSRQALVDALVSEPKRTPAVVRSA